MIPSALRPDSGPPLDPATLFAANISPTTGLAHDYLNHFNEAIMVLELVATMPDCIDEFLIWQPKSYRQHFAASRLKHRDLAIAAYEAAEPTKRRQLDELATAMNSILVAVRETLRMKPAEHSATPLAAAAAAHLRPLVARAGAVINGTESGDDAAAEEDPQAAIDALLDR